MRILDTAVSHYRSTFCILMLIIIAGLYARGNTAIEAMPMVTVPFVKVQVYLEGVSPEDGARLLVRPIESELRSLEGVKEIRATSRESLASLVIEFEADQDIDQAVTGVRNAVDRARAELPDSAEEPVVSEMSSDGAPSIVVGLTGEGVQERILFKTAQRLKHKIEDLSSVLSANMAGHREEVVEALIDPARLEHYDITSDLLIAAVFANNLLVPAGELDSNRGRFSIKVPGLIETREDIDQLPVKSSTDGVVTLGEVTDIRRTFKDSNLVASINGKRGIAISVQKRTGANLIAVSEAVRALVEREKAMMPQGIEITYIFDQSGFSRGLVREMEGNIVTAMVLVMVIVVAALGLRSGALVGLGIPFSLLFALIITYSLGFSFNMMVMFGMLLALGMLIDGSIVITEFADRKMAEGMGSRAAYRVAVKRMLWPVMASTATTLAAFLPLIFWPGVMGEFMRFLPVTVFAVLTGSLLYALFFAPVVGSLMGKPAMEPEVQGYLRRLETDSPVELGGVTGAYARLLATLLRRPVVVFMVALLTLVGIFMLYGRFNAGVEFFTETENQYGMVAVRAQGNLSAQETRDIVHRVEQRVLATPGVVMTYADSGAAAGGGVKDRIGNLLVELIDPAQLGYSSHKVFEDIRANTADLPGIKITAGTLGGGPPVGAALQIQLESTNTRKLLAATRYLHDHLNHDVEGVRDITDSSPLPGIEWEMKVDRALAAQMGASVVEVGRAVQLVTGGVKIGEYRPDDADDEVDIRLRYPSGERGLKALDYLRINTLDGPVPISSFVSREARPKVDKVERIDGVQVMILKADVEEGVLADDKVQELRAWLAQNPLDPEVKLVFRGANEEQKESFAFLGVAFSLALFLMFVLLVTQFNSFYQAILVLSAVIMSTAGVLLGLLITQATFSTALTGVGLVALAGIVVNNNIILIDTYNHTRRTLQDLSPVEAVVRACAQRLRPVFLTTITTVLGLLPVATNFSVDLIGRNIEIGGVIASFWTPLASAIVYGLIFSTLLTLVLTPVMLVLPHRLVVMVRGIRIGKDRDRVRQWHPLPGTPVES